MNDHKLDKTLQRLHSELTMTAQEHERVLSVVQEHMTHHGVANQPSLFKPSPYTSAAVWFGRIAAIAIIVLVISGSGVVALADQALPGDTLYSFKINVNEEIQSFLRPSSPTAQLVYEAARTQERIEEAQTLIKQGRFDEEAQAVVARTLAKHSETIDKQAKRAAIDEPEAFPALSEEIQDQLTESAMSLSQTAARVSLEAEDAAATVLAVADSTAQSIETISDVVVEDGPAGVITLVEQGDTSLVAVSTKPAEEYTYEHPEYLAFIVDDLNERYAQYNEEREVAAPVIEESRSEETSEEPATKESVSTEIPARTVAQEFSRAIETIDSQIDTITKIEPAEIEEENIEVIEEVVEETPETEDPLSVILAELTETFSLFESALGEEDVDEALIHKLATQALGHAQEAYDLLEAPMPTLADVFGEDVLEVSDEVQAESPRTNGVVPIDISQYQDAEEVVDATTSVSLEASDETLSRASEDILE